MAGKGREMKKIAHYLPVLIIVLGFVPRAVNLVTSPLWYDETFTVLIARLDIESLLAATIGDVHPPVYYMIINSLFQIFPGVDETLVLRGFSLFCSMVAMFQLWAISGELKLSEQTRLVGLAIMAVAPVEIYYAQEGRMYAFLQVLILAQLMAVLRRRWLELTGYTILSLYTHNYAMFYSACVYTVAIMRDLLKTREVYRAHIDPIFELGPVWSGLAAAVSFVPWIVGVLFGQMGMVAKGYWIQPLTLGTALYSLLQITWTAVMPGWLIFIAVPALALLVMFAIENGIKQRRFTLLVMAFGPMALAVAMSLIWEPVLLFRGLFGMIPALILLIAEASQQKRAWFWVAFSAPVLLIISGWMLYENNLGYIKGRHSNAVLDGPPAGAVLVHLNDSTLLPYTLYRPDVKNYYIEKHCPADHGQLSTETRAALGLETMAIEDLPERYYLAALVGPLSTPCEEETYNQLTGESEPVNVNAIPFGGGETIGYNGIWSHGIH
jgi:uncharacterized membrane protein